LLAGTEDAEDVKGLKNKNKDSGLGLNDDKE
jgi:hypothetical protein